MKHGWVAAVAGLLAGCSGMTQPQDIAVAAEMCEKRGGFTHVARYEHGRLLIISCKDETHIEVRPAERSKT